MKTITLGERTVVQDLAQSLGVRPGAVVSSALHDLGRMVTIEEFLTFDEASAIAARFGYTARRG